MNMPNRSPSIAGIMSWLLGLAIQLTARALNMPEPVLYDTGIFIFGRVQAVESSIGKRLCPVRLWRQSGNRRNDRC
jgi:hypothetical protein